MDAPHRGALMLVRFVAVALIGLGVIVLSLSWIQSSMRHTPIRAVDFVLPAVLCVLGTVFLIKANALATWISNKMDE
jgi:heme/copper-type cytochrome/quinol oxidase subunit 1